jgi:GntR family transcriptional regulator
VYNNKKNALERLYREGLSMNNRVPLYIQLSDLLREKLETKEYSFGQNIPSEPELAKIYGVSRMTVRNAIETLVHEGLLLKVQGRGTFVNKPKIDTALDTIQGFGRFLKDMGVTPSAKTIYSGKRAAGFKYARIFGITETEPIFRLYRIRFGDGEPVSLEDTYIPYNLIKNIESYDFQIYSLYDIFNTHGIKLKLDYEKLAIVKARNPEAKLLNIQPGTGLFLLEDQSIDTTGKVVEYTKGYTISERFTFSSIMI